MSTTSMLDKKTIETVKSTVPVLEEHGTAITSQFYQLLFRNHPELKNIFNQSNQRQGRQPQALANAVYAAALHIENLEAILPVVKQIGHKHRSLNIRPEHYPIVGENLLKAMKLVLGDAATDDIIDAWAKAYGVIADVFIEVEREMYEETRQTPGGWVGYRDFVVIDKVKESEVITSFYLKPADNGDLPMFKPGQYITVKVEIPGLPYTCQRHYSLSCSPNNEYLRISVKREDSIDDKPEGVVSSFLHNQIDQGDILAISAPAGDFVVDSLEQPIVLLSGGVGITPLISMMEHVLEEQPEREIYFIHAAQNAQMQGFKETLQQITNQHDQVHYYKVYEKTDHPHLCDKVGYIDLPWLKTILPNKEASFYFCGPEGFMKTIHKALIDWGVHKENIHYEFFGPQGSLED